MKNGELNIMNTQKEEFLFLEDSQNLYHIYEATCTNWAKKLIYKKNNNDGDITIFVSIENNLNKISFKKTDLKNLKKIYSLIKIIFNSNYANIICTKNDDSRTLLYKIGNSPLMMNWILNKLGINPAYKNQLNISEKNISVDDFDKIYKAEFNQNLKDDNILNPKTEIKTQLVVNNIEKPIKNTTYISNNKNERKDFNLNKILRNNNNNINNNMINMNSNQKDNINNNIMINNNNNTKNNLNKNFPNSNLNQFQNNQMFLLNNQQIMMNQMNIMNLNMMNLNMMNQINNNNLFPNNLLNMNQNNLQNNNIFEKYFNYTKEMSDNASKILKLDLLKNNENLYFSKKGLNNVGLTCYMNSTLQCLLHIVELSFYFIDSYNVFQREHLNMIQKTETKGLLSEEYKNIVVNVLSGKEEKRFFGIISSDSFSPTNFNKLIGTLNPQFKRYEANDAKDLIIYLLQEMHEELNYYGGKKLDKIPKCNQLNEVDAFNFFYKVNSTMNFSIISYLFWGIVKQTTICSTCRSTLYNFQYFHYLSFPLYNYIERFNIYNGLKDYTKKEILKGDNKFYCQICRGLREAEVKSVIYYLPQYLLINFDYGKDKKYTPARIDFGSSICITKEFLSFDIGSVNYDLIAVSSHIGSSGSSGHYIAFCKDPQNNWHKFNDSSHSLCNFEETYNYSPYLLIYKKIN